MPHAVVVGTDATALHVAGQLVARGFEVTLLEASQAIGGQWVQRLFADRTDCEFNAVEDGVFVDFPFHPGRASNPETKNKSEFDTNDESIANPSVQRRTVSAELTKVPASGPRSQQQLLSHLADYACAADLHRSIRLGCTLRRAKWQAMNGCWRLELKTESVVQRGGAQLSADFLVVSRQSMVGTRLPHLPGGELYCGTILTANDQLSGPGGSAMLEQQLRGRNVLVVGPPGPVATGWAEACRQHAGYGGSVVLLEVEEDEGATLSAFVKPQGGMRNDKSSGGGGGPFSRLFGACLGLGKQRKGAYCARMHGRGSQRRRDGPPLERFSPAQAPFQGPGRGSGNGDGGLHSPEPGSGTSGTLDDAEGLTDDELKSRHIGKDGDAEVVELDSELAAVSRLEESATGPVLAAATGIHTGGGDGGGEEAGTKQSMTRKEARDLKVREAEAVAGRRVRGSACNGGSGERIPLAAGLSSLRVITGLGATLNGTHAMLSTGEELPAEVVLLVPLGGVETSLAFLDAGGPVRMSQAGGSSVGGSFKHAGTTSLAAGSVSLVSMPETISRQLDTLYRDMLSNSPYAPNFALVGMGPRASQHDARTSAVQAAWLLSTWAGMEDHAANAEVRGGRGTCVSGSGGFDMSWISGAPAGGFIRQVSPVEAAADAALRARWKREAAKRGSPQLYQLRYLQQLLADLGAAVQAPTRWRFGGCAGASPASEHLSRQRVAKLLGLKRLRCQGQSAEEASLSRGQSPRNSPGRMLTYSYNGSGIFASARGIATAAAAGDGGIGGERGSGPTSREASRSSHQGGFPVRQGTLGPQAIALRERANGLRSGGGSFEMAMRSEGSFPAFTFSPQGGDGQGGPGGMPSLQQLAEGCFSTSSFHSAHHHHHNLNNSSNNNNSSLSFALGSNQPMLSHELQLYRVVEHPAEHLDDAGTAGGLALRSSQHHVLPSCPSSPSLAAAMSTNTGSMSGSIVSVRGQLPGARGASFSTPATPFALASSLTTSPCALGGFGAGGADAAVTGVTAAVTVPAAGGSRFPGAISAGPTSSEDSVPLGGSQQRLRSQLLQRHRSTSRLAGVSNASSLASASPPPITSNSTLSMLFGRRAPAVSISQVSFDIPKSSLTDLRSHSGRPSNTNNNSRRGINMSSGGSNGGGGGAYGASSCSSGSLGLVGRANSAVRLQLLLAAASSASRRRTARVPETQNDSPGGTGIIAGGDSKVRLQTACSDALEPLPYAGGRSAHGSRYGDIIGVSVDKPSGLGTSVVVLARAHCISNGLANSHGSVSEPVARELVSSPGSTPGSPSRLSPRKVYGKISETFSEQLPAEAAAAMAPKDVATRVSASGTSTYITGEQQWSDGEPCFQIGAGGSQGDGGMRMDRGSGAAPRGVCVGQQYLTRRRFIMLPDLRCSGGHLQHEFQDPFLPDGGGYGEEDGE